MRKAKQRWHAQSGRILQWDEMISDPEYKIGRPRQLYLGAARREVTPRTQH
jgi:citrate synthase